MHNKVMKEILKKYHAISQKCRFRIMHLFIKANVPLCICELMDVLNKPQYKISRCLSILKEANLIIERRTGRLLMYSPDLSDAFNKQLFSTFTDVDMKENPDLINDIDNLNKRLALRENGKVVVTYKT